MPSMMSGWAFVPRCFFVLSFSVCLSFTYLFSSHFYLHSDLNSFFLVDNAKANNPCASANRGVLPLAEYTPPTGYEPKLPDDFHFSETTEMIFQEEPSDAVPSCLFDAELDDETIGWALSSTLFTQERGESAGRRQAQHSHEESLLPAQSFSACHSRTGRLVHELSSLSSRSREKPSRNSENERIKILLERQKRANSRWL